MKFKLFANIGRRGLEILKASGNDVMTVVEQGLRGISDQPDIVSVESAHLAAAACTEVARPTGIEPVFPP